MHLQYALQVLRWLWVPHVLQGAVVLDGVGDEDYIMLREVGVGNVERCECVIAKQCHCRQLLGVKADGLQRVVVLQRL